MADKPKVKSKRIFKERTVDANLKRCAAAAGALVFKVHPSTNAGIPDRIVHKDGRSFYVELKRTNEKCSPLQIEMQRQLKAVGIDTFVLDTKITDFYQLFEVCYTTYEGVHYHKNPHRYEQI